MVFNLFSVLSFSSSQTSVSSGITGGCLTVTRETWDLHFKQVLYQTEMKHNHMVCPVKSALGGDVVSVCHSEVGCCTRTGAGRRQCLYKPVIQVLIDKVLIVCCTE